MTLNHQSAGYQKEIAEVGVREDRHYSAREEHHFKRAERGRISLVGTA